MILESRLRSKRFFNPKSKEDLGKYKDFVQLQTWGPDGCPFFLEFPYSTVPDMIKDKIMHHLFRIDFDRFHHINK